MKANKNYEVPWNHSEKTPHLAEDIRDNVSKLIVVPGHALLRDGVLAGKKLSYYKSDDVWRLQGFQKGEPPFYIEHIKAGVDALIENPEAILTFSGGRTRPDNQDWSEAGSYLAVAKALPEWTTELEDRVLTEDFARDSILNIFYSSLRYFMETGKFPETVEVMNWGFKASRFNNHREALGISKDQFTYTEINNPIGGNLEGAKKGEAKALDAFQKDPLALEGDLLRKREARDPHQDGNPYISLLTEASREIGQFFHLQRKVIEGLLK